MATTRVVLIFVFIVLIFIMFFMFSKFFQFSKFSKFFQFSNIYESYTNKQIENKRKYDMNRINGLFQQDSELTATARDLIAGIKN